ncbi:HDIG domain-containing metalloprotein [Dictyobacter kobayashii]|uniref:Phosphohydrolase n=1 Tax=Dictyobacter kobayashii TaxID=2014872 RepID=A0A402AU90_9CHLR|nr:HDIG domain-containing metalloprotein [Dictyobacter kobayashii]GCE22716.1 phosphohydrolase [Dictyobacter kobayashii]
MSFRQLPPEALRILKQYGAAPRLIAHLTVVHDVAYTLTQLLLDSWPELAYDREAVLLGSALHDIGKTMHTAELSGPGTQHEEVGPQLLLATDLPVAYARFARTHARWQNEPGITLEDMLVAFADTIWKGKRDADLEQGLAGQIAQHTHQERWEIYMRLDDIASALARDADERILWQGQHTI